MNRCIIIVTARTCFSFYVRYKNAPNDCDKYVIRNVHSNDSALIIKLFFFSFPCAFLSIQLEIFTNVIIFGRAFCVEIIDYTHRNIYSKYCSVYFDIFSSTFRPRKREFLSMFIYGILCNFHNTDILLCDIRQQKIKRLNTFQF